MSLFSAMRRLLPLALVVPATAAHAGCLVSVGFSPGKDVPQLESVLAVAAAEDHGLALLPDRTLVRWGIANTALSIPSDATNVTAIAAGYRQLLVARADGSVLGWGQPGLSTGPIPAEATNAVAVAAGEKFCAVLRKDGTVVAWGTWSGENVTLPPDLSNVAAISAGYYHLMCLSSNGTVQSFGYDYGQITVPEGLSGVTSIAAGFKHSLALKSDGTVIGWGDTYSGAGDTVWTGIKAIGAGNLHDLGVKSNGTVVVHGHYYANPDYQIPVWNLTNAVAVCAGADFSVAVVQAATPPTAHIECLGGLVRVRFAGQPGLTYALERSDTVDFGSPTVLLETNAPPDGLFEFEDANAPAQSAYYRLVHY